MMSIALRTARGIMLLMMSMRMCSLSRSVHDAHSRKTTLNSTHCSSSQAFDDTSNVLRTTALIADTATAAKIAQAHHLPICTLTASIRPLSLRSARTAIPVPPNAYGAAPLSPLPWHRPTGHHSRHNEPNGKSTCARKGSLLRNQETGAGEGHRNLDIQLGKLSLSH